EISQEDACRVLVDVARALHTAHEAGVVHRDVKPSNILIDAQGRGLLSDFGLAKDLTSQSLTQSGMILGTFAYMSPEQVNPGKDPLDLRADVYALGAILYHIVSG